MKPKRPEPEKLAQFLWRVTNLPLVFITIGLLLLGAGSWLLFGTSNQNRNAEKAMAQAEALAAALGDQVTLITDTLMTEAVQAKALEALADAGKIQAVKTLMEANLDGVHSVEVLGTDLLVIDPETLGQSGLIKVP